MSSVLSFVLMIVIVVLVAAFGMWAAQRIAARFKKLPASSNDLDGDETAVRHDSPDGRYALVTTSWRTDSGHRVATPALYDVRERRTVVALDRRWSADVVIWSLDSCTVTLQLRKYPADVPGLTIAIEPSTGRTRAETRAGAEEIPLEALRDWLDGYAQRFGRPAG